MTVQLAVIRIITVTSLNDDTHTAEAAAARRIRLSSFLRDSVNSSREINGSRENAITH